ncbi:hypothetical protein PUN28_005873 [Cardiocondyla obscurior]|uniref:Uncharacterized protein n=1 Tax=Cardiocondyla obscurior TaxID=286306 RepID=A0AAW2GAY8_9HYME
MFDQKNTGEIIGCCFAWLLSLQVDQAAQPLLQKNIYSFKFIPTIPIDPTGPGYPLSPFSPTGPGKPFTPSHPLSPFSPEGPSSPLGPKNK